MGLFDFLRGSKAHSKRIIDAADQMWDAVSRGINFEVPVSFAKDDDVMQALGLLSQKHPEVQLRVRQSRGIVVTLVKDTKKVSKEAMGQLDKGGYIPERPEETLEQMLAAQERFMRQQGLDPEKEADKAYQEQRARDAMEVTLKLQRPKLEGRLLVGDLDSDTITVQVVERTGDNVTTNDVVIKRKYVEEIDASVSVRGIPAINSVVTVWLTHPLEEILKLEETPVVPNKALEATS